MFGNLVYKIFFIFIIRVENLLFKIKVLKKYVLFLICVFFLYFDMNVFCFLLMSIFVLFVLVLK